MPDCVIMFTQSAEFTLNEIGMHSLGGSLQTRSPLDLGGRLQRLQCLFDLLPGAPERRRHLGHDLNINGAWWRSPADER